MFLNPMKLIDNFLNTITMYRLVLLGLIFILAGALLFCFMGILPYRPLDLLFSTLFLVAVSFLANDLFSKTFNAPVNVESVYISALILALIITPLRYSSDLPLLFWAAVLSMASKYILAVDNKHLFNPVAFAVGLTAITIGKSASWWVGSLAMLPFVAVIGFLVIRKLKKFELINSFFVVTLTVIVAAGLLNGVSPVISISKTLFYSPLLFFAFIMLTEPLTTPPTKKLQLIYGALVGLLFAPPFHLGNFYTTPEVALLIGNLFSYAVSPKAKLMLRFKEKISLSPDIYDFVFTPNRKFNYLPGQYLEWTLGHPSPDSRGNRRYFTLSSSPTEADLRIGVKFYSPASSFKNSLLALPPESRIMAGQLAGEFILPADPDAKLAFIAGGIGITPFRSMLKYLIDTKQKRDVVLFYSARSAPEFVYRDIFREAHEAMGLKVVYLLTDSKNIDPNWAGRVGYLDEPTIRAEAPDYLERLFYLSGPHALVTSFERLLGQLDVPKAQIKTDYFPGFA